jgi:hypothetical protein
MIAAGPFQTSKVTRLAQSVAGGIATIAVNAEARRALVAVGTRLAFTLLDLALAGFTVEAVTTIGVAGTHGAATVAVALVGTAVIVVRAAAHHNTGGILVQTLPGDGPGVVHVARSSPERVLSALGQGPYAGCLIAATGADSFARNDFIPGTQSTSPTAALLQRCLEGLLSATRFGLAADKHGAFRIGPAEGFEGLTRGGGQAGAVTITVAGSGECLFRAKLVRADCAARPVPASARAVALPVRTASRRCFLDTLALRVGAFRWVVARSNAVADLTQSALGLGVGAQRVIGAGTFVGHDVAGPATASASAVAAEAVNTLVTQALILDAASSSVWLLGHTDRAQAVEPWDAVGIACTRGLAPNVTVANIRGTRLRTRIKTGPSTIAVVGQEQCGASAKLSLALDTRTVLGAVAHATALAGEAAGKRFQLIAIGLRVGSCGGILAEASTGTDAADPALAFRVGVVRDVKADAFPAGLVAGLTLSSTRTVAADSINAVPRGTLVGTGARFA